MIAKYKNIIVAANDAGGAEILAAYILERRNKINFICAVSGPAAEIMKRDKISFVKIADSARAAEDFLDRHKNADFILTGTGWMTGFEINFLRAARERGIKAAAFIDHWINYRERFGYPKKGWQKNLPDEIWLGDRDAFKIALELFPRRTFSFLKIRLVANPYFRRLRRDFRKMRKFPGSAVLYLSEPHPFAVDIFGKILEFLDIQNFKGKLAVRFHPADDKAKYDKLIKKFSGKINIEKSKGKSLPADIAGAGAVIGIETTALVIARIAGKKAVSFIPKGWGKCPLPQSSIKKVYDFKNLRSTIGVLLN